MSATNPLIGNSLPNQLTRGMRVEASSWSPMRLRLEVSGVGSSSSEVFLSPNPTTCAATKTSRSVLRTSGMRRP